MSEKPPLSRTQYASIKDPTITAAVDGLFRFANKEQALNMLKQFSSRFVIKKKSPVPSIENPFLTLWISGFSISEVEKQAGYLGHYAEISIKPVEDNRYALIAKKLDIDIKNHPKRMRPVLRHPDWGHPILRAVKKGTPYPTLAEGQKQLMLLHKEYPETTIPGHNLLHVMVYRRKSEGKKHEQPVQKIIIEIKPVSQDEVKLVLKEKPLQKPETGPAPAEAPSGTFTTMVEMRRKKKMKKKVLPLRKNSAESES